MRIFFYFLPLALAIALAISCKSSTQTESKEVKQEIVYGGYNSYIEDYAGGFRVVSE